MTGAAIAGEARPAVRPLEGRLADTLLALFVGVSAFLAVVGPRVLDVTNIRWLAPPGTSDPITHYLGWEFFRRGPWTWPPGLNPTYGLEFSSSIVFSDSVPIIAIPLKLLSPLLPDVFQYTGWWILACFLLQAWFAVRIAGLFSKDAVVKLALAVLLSFAPPMLWRLSVHYSLVAHWIVLAAIYLYWAPPMPRRWLHWTLLLGASALIHTYLLGMCAPIWLASVVRRRRLAGTSSPPWLMELAVVLLVAVGALWVGGFFPLRSSMLSSGYGLFRLNVLSLINPEGGIGEDQHWRWSPLLQPLPHAFGDYEGFAYAGLGVLAACLLALPLLWTERRAYTGAVIWPLLIAAVLLTLFAISPNITIFDRTIALPVPQFVFQVASSMRSSGRFFWPVYYLLPITAAWLLHRALGDRAAGPLLLLLAALQVYDTYPGWSALRAQLNVAGSTFESSIDDPRLGDVASHYQAIRMLPAGNQAPNWAQVADFALHQRLPTDAVYLARPDDAGYASYMAGIDDTIDGHKLATNALYFLDGQFAAKVAAHMAGDDAMFRVGDFYVFAPGWTSRGATTTLPEGRPGSPQ